jgi:hypothetical protein
MPVRFLSDAELSRLGSWPAEIAEHDLITFFTLSSDDAAWLGGNVRPENRLGAAVQLCTLPWLGWIPDDLTGCPSATALPPRPSLIVANPLPACRSAAHPAHPIPADRRSLE